MKFNYKIDNLEIRSCDSSLTSFGKHDRAEIVLWHKNNKLCYTIAYFKPTEDYFDLISCGDRICDKEVNIEYFMRLVKFGFKKLLK